MNKVKRKFFAAYGSLMNVDKMIQVCPESYVFGWGSIQDFYFEFRGFENKKISTECNAPVVLWSITEEDEKELDSFLDLEIYRKDDFKIKLTDVNDIVTPYSVNYYRERVKALVYIMKEENINPKKSPSLELYHFILEGYRKNNIGTDPLNKAVILEENTHE